jgi:hypothetical protein
MVSDSESFKKEFLAICLHGWPRRSRWLSTAAARVRARVWQLGFVVDKVASGQVFSEYFGFPYQHRSFHQLLHHHNHPEQLAEALQRADHPSKESADCPRSSNQTESFMEAAKTQNWAVEPQEKNVSMDIHNK